MESVMFQKMDQRIASIREEMRKASEKSPYGQKTRLLLATKTRTPEEINHAISLGVDLIGENRVQELIEKYPHIHREGVSIHFIGALQTNKVKYIVDKVDMIESVDRLPLAAEIEKQCAKIGKTMDILVEINIGGEKTKSGVDLDEAKFFIEKLKDFPHLRVRGLMTVPPKMTELDRQKEYFQKIMDLYIDISAKKSDNNVMDCISMGMSDDYPIAIECGSTEVRIGSAAFGPRNYQI